jgi:hypothetical protein
MKFARCFLVALMFVAPLALAPEAEAGPILRGGRAVARGVGRVVRAPFRALRRGSCRRGSCR